MTAGMIRANPTGIVYQTRITGSFQYKLYPRRDKLKIKGKYITNKRSLVQLVTLLPLYCASLHSVPGPNHFLNFNIIDYSWFDEKKHWVIFVQLFRHEFNTWSHNRKFYAERLPLVHGVEFFIMEFHKKIIDY